MKSPRLLFFTRGRGRGHAIPDLAIVDRLRAQAPEIDLQFASYSTGKDTLAQAGHRVLDMEVEDGAPYLELLVRCSRIIQAHKPDVVVSHEEFAALPAARIAQRPAVFIVDFFPPPIDIWRESLRYADRVLFIERRGIFPEPPEVKGRVAYAGPIVRPLQLNRQDRVRTRTALELTMQGVVISVIPGAWATEARAPAFQLVLAAFRELPLPDKQLIWIAGADYDELSRAALGCRDVRVLRQHSPIEQVMVSSDLVVTKANRGTTMELSRLGIPSISLSSGLNPIDEAIVTRIHSNLALHVKGVDAGFLARTMREVLDAGPETSAVTLPREDSGGASVVAGEIAGFVAAL